MKTDFEFIKNQIDLETDVFRLLQLKAHYKNDLSIFGKPVIISYIDNRIHDLNIKQESEKRNVSETQVRIEIQIKKDIKQKKRSIKDNTNIVSFCIVCTLFLFIILFSAPLDGVLTTIFGFSSLLFYYFVFQHRRKLKRQLKHLINDLTNLTT